MKYKHLNLINGAVLMAALVLPTYPSVFAGWNPVKDVSGAVHRTVKAIGNGGHDAIKAVGNGGHDAIKAVGDGGHDAIKAVGDGGHDVIKAVGDGGHDVIKAVGDGGHDVIKAVGDGGHDVIKTVGNGGHDVIKAVGDGGHDVIKAVGKTANKAGVWIATRLGVKSIMDKANHLLNEGKLLFDQFMDALTKMGKLAPVIGISFLVLFGLTAFWIAGNALKAWGVSPRATLVVAGVGFALWVLAQPSERSTEVTAEALVAQQTK